MKCFQTLHSNMTCAASRWQLPNFDDELDALSGAFEDDDFFDDDGFWRSR
jgi:hypothetical protein